MPINLISCVSLPPATVTVVPIHDFAIANGGVVVVKSGYPRNNIIHVADRAFAEGAYTPSGSLVSMIIIRFAILNEVTKQMKKMLKRL
jgi:hypothetical protein